MKAVGLLAVLFIATSTAVASDSGDWLIVANEGIERGDPKTIEQSLDLCEKSQFLSVSRSLGSVLAPKLHPIICTDLERQFLAYAAASRYLDIYQEHPTDAALEDFRVATNRLYAISYRQPFLASRLIVAKVRALDGKGGYDISGPPPIPLNTKWHFWMGIGYPQTAIVDDFRSEYRAILDARAPSILAAVCILGLVIPCAFTLRSNDALEIHALVSFPISLIISDERGRELDLPDLRQLAKAFHERRPEE